MVVYEADIVDNEMPYYLGQPHRLAFVEAFCFRRVCMLGIGGLMVFMGANCARRGRISSSQSEATTILDKKIR